MAKVTLENGMVFEGTNDELVELFTKLGAKIPAVEEAPVYRKVTDRKARVGDYVKFSETYDDDITVGKYYEIIAFDFDNDPEFVDDVGDENVASSGEEKFEIYEKVFTTDEKGFLTDLYVDTYAEPAPEYKYEVGGYARLKSLNDPLLGFKIGQIVKLHDNPNSASDFKVTPLDGGNTGYSDVKNFEPVSEEEVAEAKSQDKWASINRKPNEFKKGDIVRVIGGNVHQKGTIGEVGNIDGDIFRVEANGRTAANWHNHEEVELLTPAEARVDR